MLLSLFTRMDIYLYTDIYTQLYMYIYLRSTPNPEGRLVPIGSWVLFFLLEMADILKDSKDCTLSLSPFE